MLQVEQYFDGEKILSEGVLAQTKVALSDQENTTKKM